MQRNKIAGRLDLHCLHGSSTLIQLPKFCLFVQSFWRHSVHLFVDSEENFCQSSRPAQNILVHPHYLWNKISVLLWTSFQRHLCWFLSIFLKKVMSTSRATSRSRMSGNVWAPAKENRGLFSKFNLVSLRPWKGLLERPFLDRNSDRRGKRQGVQEKKRDHTDSLFDDVDSESGAIFPHTLRSSQWWKRQMLFACQSSKKKSKSLQCSQSTMKVAYNEEKVHPQWMMQRRLT